MKKTIIFYGRRNTGLIVLPFIVAKGYNVKVMSDDVTVQWTAAALGLEMVELDTMGKFDLFLSCHGTIIIKKKYLDLGTFVNIHPCLNLYPGKDPISKYIADKRIRATVSSHYMIEKIDAGEQICEVPFETPVCETYADFYNVAYRYYLICVNETLNRLGL